eukprot:3458271-Prymnesium_polylepis.1
MRLLAHGRPNSAGACGRYGKLRLRALLRREAKHTCMFVSLWRTPPRAVWVYAALAAGAPQSPGGACKASAVPTTLRCTGYTVLLVRRQLYRPHCAACRHVPVSCVDLEADSGAGGPGRES